jgi:hypothetical protein
MRKYSINGIFVILFMLCFGKISNAQQVFKTTPSTVIGYLEYLPSDYNSNSDKYPVVIFLHGIGERGVESTDPAVLETTISSVTNIGPPMHVKNGTSFPFILISPQLKRNYNSWPSWYVLEVINYVKTYLRIDERRIHVTGLSLGGGGAWVAAQDHPTLFATLSPVCGGYNSTSKACGIAAEDLPTWAFHGDKDTIVPLSKTVNMINAINACVPAPAPAAKVDIYAGVAHDAWVRAYEPDHSYHNPNVYDWMMSYTNTLTAGNSIPIANAGSDKTITISAGSFSLTGAATDQGGSISSYQWTKMSGPGASLSGTTSPTLVASSLGAGVYVFRLQVTDNTGLTDSDYVKVTVSANIPPVANAGADKVISLPLNSTVIIGSGTDADGTIASYSWSKLAGPSATLSGTNTASLSVGSLVSGTYTFRLTVIDNKGGGHSDQVNLTVNNPPTVFAGADYSINLPNNAVTVPGTASDADGSIVSYNWKMTTGTVATLSGTSTPTLSATGLIAGRYVFRLTVKDNYGASKFDDILITVTSTSGSSVIANASPVASAGSDRVISLPTNSITLSGSGSDSDGTITSYTWSKVTGGAATLANAATANVNISGLTAGTYVFRLTVKDNSGATHSDDLKITVNNPPTVSAGTDVKITLPTNSASVTAVASDPDGSIGSYSWVMLTGPSAATLTGTSTPTLSVSGLVAGPYVFRVAVRDNHGVKSFDDVMVIVNRPPVANAGSDRTITLPASSITINGSASDPDGFITHYIWKQISGGAATLGNTSSSSLYVSGLVAGQYIFRLTVWDNAAGSHTDDVRVTVQSSTSGTAHGEPSIITFDPQAAAEESAENTEVDLINEDAGYWADKVVVIFNGSGQEIFKGKWSADLYAQILDRGLYIVNIMRGSTHLAQRKIYKVN